MDLKCGYIYFRTSDGNLYGRDVRQAFITHPKTVINSFIGKHLPQMDNRNVKVLLYHDTVVEYIPKNLANIFPNLEFFGIAHCGLKSISRDDSKGLECLKRIILRLNELCSLPFDLLVV